MTRPSSPSNAKEYAMQVKESPRMTSATRTPGCRRGRIRILMY